MQTIAISNQKGGVGKSTVAVHQALHLKEADKRILFIDLDPQANATKTLRKIKSAKKMSLVASDLFSSEETSFELEDGNIHVIEADQLMADVERYDPKVLMMMKENLSQFSNDFDYCIIDTPPTLGLRMTGALLVSDFVLAPIELEEYGIDGIKKMLQTIFGVKEKWNKQLSFLGMLPNRFNPRSLAQKATLENLMTDYAHLLIPAPIGIRSSIPEALSEGIPVWKLKKTSARVAGKEFKKAFMIVDEKMEANNNE